MQPASVLPIDSITVTANALNLDPKKKATYTWTTAGGQITGTDATASVSSAGLAAGDYTVSAHISQGSKPSQQASCTTAFHIHAYEPPTISCSANPSNVMSGETSTITSIGARRTAQNIQRSNRPV